MEEQPVLLPLENQQREPEAVVLDKDKQELRQVHVLRRVCSEMQQQRAGVGVRWKRVGDQAVPKK